MRVLDLFSGIGGFSLGLERAGMRTVAFCEIEPYARAVLAKHWPNVPCYDDIRTLTADRFRADGVVPDVICGGFPCQDISKVGRGAGLGGLRSGLWREYARLIQESLPKWVIIENVSALRNRGLGDILSELAALGYDAEWHCIPASAIGARHKRDRLWLVAYPKGARAGLECQETSSQGWLAAEIRRACLLQNDGGPSNLGTHTSGDYTIRDAWTAEPDVGRVAHGVPSRLDRLKCLGNSVVPQIPEMIGRALMVYENSLR